MITFPTTPEIFIADQEAKAGKQFDDFWKELITEYTEVFNIAYDLGLTGEEPIDIIGDAVKFYNQKGKLKELERPEISRIYATIQHWCNVAYKQGKEAAQHD